jgi:hypothetical protein
MLATPVTVREVISPMLRNERSKVENDADVASRQNIRVALTVNNLLIEKLCATLMKYRAIKIFCNRVIHVFESVCRYLNYTLNLLYKRKIKCQLKGKMVASLK